MLMYIKRSNAMELKKTYSSPEIMMLTFSQEDIITISTEPTTGGIELPDDIWVNVQCEKLQRKERYRAQKSVFLWFFVRFLYRMAINMKIIRFCFVLLLLCCMAGCGNLSEQPETPVVEESASATQEILFQPTESVQNPTENSMETVPKQDFETETVNESVSSDVDCSFDIHLDFPTNTKRSDGGIELPDDIW